MGETLRKDSTGGKIDFPRQSNVVRMSPRDRFPADDVCFTAPSNYAEYVVRTNEKGKLRQILDRAFCQSELPIRPGDRRKRVLDLGSGLGDHTWFLSTLFRDHDVDALDVSKQFLAEAEATVAKLGLPNVKFEPCAFEDFDRRYDFILCSHVLQYIDTAVEPFIKKILDALRPDGEAWIVLQEERGLNQLIQAARPYIVRPSQYFTDWFTHERVRRFIVESQISAKIETFPSCFKAPEMERMTDSEEHFLQFILLGGFDAANGEMVAALHDRIMRLSPSGIVRHDVGITKIRRTW